MLVSSNKVTRDNEFPPYPPNKQTIDGYPPTENNGKRCAEMFKRMLMPRTTQREYKESRRR